MSQGLCHGAIEMSDLTSVTAFRALNISIVTRTERARVPGRLSLKTSQPKPLANLAVLGHAMLLRSWVKVIIGPAGLLHIHQM